MSENGEQTLVQRAMSVKQTPHGIISQVTGAALCAVLVWKAIFPDIMQALHPEHSHPSALNMWETILFGFLGLVLLAGIDVAIDALKALVSLIPTTGR